MALFNLSGMKKFYVVMVKCRNCGTISELKVTKGVTVQEFFQSGMALCSNCGCSQLNVKSNPPVPVAHGKTKPLPNQVGGTW